MEFLDTLELLRFASSILSRPISMSVNEWLSYGNTSEASKTTCKPSLCQRLPDYAFIFK